jgi:predicted AlkP superfamily pyrophosphatase or phosphodiesterase
MGEESLCRGLNEFLRHVHTFEDPYQYVVPDYEIDYKFLVANGGRLPDILDLNVSSLPENWTIKFYHQDGITPLNDTNNNGYPDTVMNGAQKMVLIARLKRSAPAPKGEIAKISVTVVSSGMPNQTSSASLTGVTAGTFFSISDESLRSDGEHPYYGEKFSGHNVNPGENTTYVINVFNMGPNNPPPITLQIQDESVPEGWQAFLYYKDIASQTVVISEEDIPKIGDHVEVWLYVTPPQSASEGETAEIVVYRVETLEAAKFIARVTSERKVYILNLDGMPPEYVHQELMPNLWKLREEGSYYTNASAHLIAATAINHVGIIVSADTQTHGILTAGTVYLGWNENRSMPEWRLYEYEDIPVETIFTTIKRSNLNLRTGVVSGKFWIADLFQGPDTDIKAHGYEHPFYIDEPEPYWLGDPNDPETDPTKETKYISFAGAKGSPSDHYIIKTAMEIIRNEDPDFLYVLLANPDIAGHSYGDAYDGATEINPKANPETMLDVIENITDKSVGTFMDFLKKRGTYEDVIIAVTSDHSVDTMYPEIEIVYENETPVGLVHRTVDVREILENEGIVMGEDYEYGTGKGYVAMLYGFKNNETIQQAKLILENYKVVFTNLTGGISVYDENPIRAVLERETMPEYRLYNELVISGATDRVWPELIVLMNEHYGGGVGGHGSLSTLSCDAHSAWTKHKERLYEQCKRTHPGYSPDGKRLNGRIYPDGHCFSDHEEEGAVLDCIIKDPVQNYTFNLEIGLNLISPPLTSKLYTAEFFGQAITNATSIAYWNSTVQDWVTHPIGTNISNFKIVEAMRYLLTSQQKSPSQSTVTQQLNTK